MIQLVNMYFPVKSVFAKTAALSHLELASRRKQTFRSEKIIIIVHRDCLIVQKCLITQHLQIVPLSYLKIDVFLISLSHAVASLPHLPRRLNALYYSQADNYPGSQQRQSHPPVQTPAVCDCAGDVQGLAVPEVRGC